MFSVIIDILFPKDSIHVGVSGDPLLQKKQFASLLEPVEDRFRNVVKFLNLVNHSITKDVFLLNEPFGPTITDPRIDILVLSKETESALSIINEKRIAASMNVLPAIVVDYLLDSSQIPNYLHLLREGEVDSEKFAAYRISSTSIRKKINGPS